MFINYCNKGGFGLASMVPYVTPSTLATSMLAPCVMTPLHVMTPLPATNSFVIVTIDYFEVPH